MEFAALAEDSGKITGEYNPLSADLIQHGGDNGIVAFEDMFPQGLTPPCGQPGFDDDVQFLESLDVDFETYWGSEASQVHRFMCIPKVKYSGKMPSAADIVRDLRNEAHFSGRIEDMTMEEPTYFEGPGDDMEEIDQVHTDPADECVFATAAELGSSRSARKSSEFTGPGLEDRHIAAHTQLRQYVKGNRLYCAHFNCKKEKVSSDEEWVVWCYLFVVGVSPHS
eukprot:IDg3236t1